MRTSFLLVLFAATSIDPAAAAKARYSPSVGQSAVYVCADGRRVEVLYAGGDAVALTLDGRTVELNRAPAADGERYVGAGLQWWGISAREGTLAGLPAVPGGGTLCRAG